MAKVMLRPENAYFCGSSTYRERSKSLTSAAMRVGNFDASKCVIRPMPLPPARSTSHMASMSFPTGVMTPMPVTTTRRLMLHFPMTGIAYLKACVTGICSTPPNRPAC